ncbi:MAG: 4-hydroxy-tetrahydrodipicolinate synthase [Planctomycetaceae bacterium]|jgi:4-hydroxy-tetrahydrodipicolinate synthase|nr:4-hydroxy-tetrahydrodipicolinate synthase [Planctomycetaceae bacterium]
MSRFEEFAGLSTAIITPFKNGEVDYNRLQEHIEFQIAAGTTAVVPVGTTGESPTLSFEEHERVLRAVVEAANGKIKVIAGAGANSTAEALHLTKFVKKVGADAALVVTPYYNKPTQEGIYQHYKHLAMSVDIPICVYNIPGRCVRNIEPDTIIRLAEFPNIGLVKEATGSMDQASAIIAKTDLTVLSGDDSLTLPLMSLGARGVISVVGNIVPQDMIALCKTFDSGNLTKAKELHYKMFVLCRDMLSLSTNPIPIKAAMKMLCRDTGELRLPMTPLTESEEAKLRQTLTDYGFDLTD